MTSIRIAKAISEAGICSRRKAEDLIREGLVTVNNEIISSPALNVADNDIIKIKGEEIIRKQKLRIWIFYKPVGILCTHKDTENRKNLFQILPKNMPRVISVGRLDMQSEGLILLTNSGDFARSMELPSSNVERVYMVRSFGKYNIKEMEKIAEGITIDGEFFKPKSIENTKKSGFNSWFKLTLTEGKNREIRKIFAHFNLKISKLIRISYGDYSLNNMQPGEIREVIL